MYWLNFLPTSYDKPCIGFNFQIKKSGTVLSERAVSSHEMLVGAAGIELAVNNYLLDFCNYKSW